MFVGLEPRGSPAVTLDLGSAADMFVGPTAPRWRATSAARRRTSSTAATRDLGSAADMFVGPKAPRWPATSAARRITLSDQQLGRRG